MSYRKRREWSDKFIPQIQEILGRQLVQIAPDEEDQQRNTDLHTLQMQGGKRIACRVRSYKHYLNYRDDITIRCSSRMGASEWSKIQAGWGDILFYGFANEGETGLKFWRMIDMDLFRSWAAGRKPEVRQSKTGQTFLVFAVTDASGVVMDKGWENEC